MSTDNMRIYNQSRAVPPEAQKSFNNGRFSGTDINPMWRIIDLRHRRPPAVTVLSFGLDFLLRGHTRRAITKKNEVNGIRHNLKNARLSLGLKQADMAEKLFITRQHYSSIESGKRTGAVDIWDKLEEITGIHQCKLREDSTNR